MSEDHSVSRRTTLKSLGVAGAAVVLGGATETEPKPSAQGETRLPVVDLAAERMTKGHS